MVVGATVVGGVVATVVGAKVTDTVGGTADGAVSVPSDRADGGVTAARPADAQAATSTSAARASPRRRCRTPLRTWPITSLQRLLSARL